ncbi:MAG: PTS sugar transporter subunit IIC/EAL domain-containing protein, partial [Oscillibacter sp.]|nr:PTS sugar transporter subunit IIC/EAL domain-containing protein [Oscillibacter sp.]
MKNTDTLFPLIRKAERSTIVRSVRGGLVNMIPILLIGAFALILKTFPVEAYQRGIAVFANGFLLQLFDLVYGATFGVLSVSMTIFISRAYMKIRGDIQSVHGGAVAAALVSFFILAGAYLPDFGTENMGPKSMFLALLTGLGASALYLRFQRALGRSGRNLFTRGADREFNRMITTLAPIAIVALIFALFNAIVIRAFDVDSFRTLLIHAFNHLFSIGKPGFFKGFFFVLFSSLLWFFGIHGSDTLEGVMQNYFTPGLAANQAAVAAGTAPTTILTKEFFDCFVLMGGCGATICLLITILLFSSNRARRGLGYAAAFPMLFNINELMVFGLPIIFNPIMLVPFLAVPIVCYSVAYFALSSGIVPIITSNVEWTTPILLGGFRATGSVAGSLLQLVNVALGVLIYLPFVRLLDRQTSAEQQENYKDFVEYFQKNEAELASRRLIEQGTIYGDFAKGLCADLRADMDKCLDLYYQPQFHYDGRCIGAEALLRWKHPAYGMLYPPLVVKMAEEGGFLAELEEKILLRALADRPEVLRRFGTDVSLSVNVTGLTAVTPRYFQFICRLNEKDPFRNKNICIEVTEQATLALNEETRSILRMLREMGIHLAIDDFSMGQT